MSKLLASYWKIFNILARIVGGGFILNGSVISIWGFALVIGKSKDYSSTDKWLIACVPLLVVLFGILLLRAQPYRPDLREARPSDKNNKQ